MSAMPAFSRKADILTEDGQVVASARAFYTLRTGSHSGVKAASGRLSGLSADHGLRQGERYRLRFPDSQEMTILIGCLTTHLRVPRTKWLTASFVSGAAGDQGGVQ